MGGGALYLLEKGSGRLRASYFSRSFEFSFRHFVDIPGPNILFLDEEFIRDDDQVITQASAYFRLLNVETGESTMSNAVLTLDEKSHASSELIPMPDGRVMIVHGGKTRPSEITARVDIYDPATDELIDIAEPDDMRYTYNTLHRQYRVDSTNNLVCISGYHLYNVTADIWTTGSCGNIFTENGISEQTAGLKPGDGTYISVIDNGTGESVLTNATYAGRDSRGYPAVVTAGTYTPANEDCNCESLLIGPGQLVLY